MMYCIGVMWYVHKLHDHGPFCSSGNQLQTSHFRGVGSVPRGVHMGFAVDKWHWSRVFSKHFVSYMLVLIPIVLHTFVQSKCATTGLCEVTQTGVSSLHSCCCCCCCITNSVAGRLMMVC